MWNSTHFAPQWLSVELDGYYLGDKIEMVITQSIPGATTHEIWLTFDDGHRYLYKTLANVHTEDGLTLKVIVDPPKNINGVQILTTKGEGWVAWRELRVFKTVGSEMWTLKEFESGFELPVQVAHAGEESGRLFVAEQKGRVRIVHDGSINEEPFLDIQNQVRCCEGEQGFYNIAFPPNYADRQHFYVSYTNIDGDTVISRFRTTANPDISDPDSEEILLVIPQPHKVHNGGHMVFGPKDGYLYIGSGDGGIADSRFNSQEPGTFLGKILRIDVESGAEPYAIPESNPFAQADGYRGEIWALGLRNPWGFAFDEATGDLYIPDAGRSEREEVNYQAGSSSGGENYGWPAWEGDLCHEEPSLSCDAIETVMPVAVYSHSKGCVVVGGAFSRGVFLYADFCRGRIWKLQRGEEGWGTRAIIARSVPISSINRDEAGNLYVAGHADGVIYALEVVR